MQADHMSILFTILSQAPGTILGTWKKLDCIFEWKNEMKLLHIVYAYKRETASLTLNEMSSKHLLDLYDGLPVIKGPILQSIGLF